METTVGMRKGVRTCERGGTSGESVRNISDRDDSVVHFFLDLGSFFWFEACILGCRVGKLLDIREATSFTSRSFLRVGHRYM